jgi:hypothetical protein
MVLAESGAVESEIQKDIPITADMKRYLVVTIDVEPDCSPTWHYADPLTFSGISEGIARILQPLFNRYNITPTYLINNVVLEDRDSVETFRRLDGKYELGTHLHPEFILPDKKYEGYAGKKATANCCFYPPDIEFEKIRNITLLFEQALGYRPRVFRAGRYSAGLNTMQSLRQLGYLVDTSVTPHVCWNDPSRERPVDFNLAPEQPYWLHRGSITREDPDGDLLEVPVSIALRPRNMLREMIVSAGGLRHPLRRSKACWLRPYYSSTPQLLDIARRSIPAGPDRGTTVLNMMFHNVEVMPGLSPYSLTGRDCRKYLQQLEDFFSFCRQEGIESVALSDLYHVFKK